MFPYSKRLVISIGKTAADKRKQVVSQGVPEAKEDELRVGVGQENLGREGKETKIPKRKIGKIQCNKR